MQRFQDSENTLPVTPLYDSEAVRRVLARASQIEAQSTNELLNAGQVEALGEEIGLSPGAVRRALGEARKIGEDVPLGSQTQTRSVPLTRDVLKSACLPNLLLALFWIPSAFIESRAVDTGSMSGETLIALVCYVYLPMLFLLATRFGFVAKRAGLGIGGAWLTTCITIAFSCVSGYFGSIDHSTPVTSMLMTNFIFSLLGIFGGALGVGARYVWDHLPRNAQRLQNVNR